MKNFFEFTRELFITLRLTSNWICFVKIILIQLFLACFLSNLSLAEDSADKSKIKILSTSSIFEPMLADPKYPRFTLAYYNYSRGAFGGHHIFSPNLGAVLPLAVYESTDGIKYEFSVLGGVFSIMDLGANPTRLINADYLGGAGVAIKNNKQDYLIRVAHTSSHIGDELLLSKVGQGIKRINLSYETAEVIAGYNFEGGFRPFIGLGYIIHADPKDFRSSELTIGLDYRSTDFYLDGYAKPIAGIYSKTSKNYGWHPNLSIKAGLEFNEHFAFNKKLQLLLEYYNGKSIHGQFYNKREHYIGPSININF